GLGNLPDHHRFAEQQSQPRERVQTSTPISAETTRYVPPTALIFNESSIIQSRASGAMKETVNIANPQIAAPATCAITRMRIDALLHLQIKDVFQCGTTSRRATIITMVDLTSVFIDNTKFTASVFQLLDIN
ncbi:MAG: hypothetical protein O3C17_26370, partial [Planctomycetota bacterium]|nr:hypothetical protein [Planctomycetota bacterium]